MGCWIRAIVCIVVVIAGAGAIAIVVHRMINPAATEGEKVGPNLVLFRVVVGMSTSSY